MADQRLTGYRRPDGRVGIRNHVVILPVDDLSNAVAESVARGSRARWPSRIRMGGCSSAPTWSCSSRP